MIPKKQFNSFTDAQDFLDLMGDKEMHPYKCTICNKWHIGH